MCGSVPALESFHEMDRCGEDKRVYLCFTGSDGSTVHAGASRKNDSSLCDRICADLCGTGDLTEKKSHWGRSLMVFNSVPSALL